MNGALRLKQKAMELAQPLNVHLELTYSCNWRCVFCYNPRHFDRERLSTEQWLAALDELRYLGTLNITFTGGEPLTRDDFFAIARGARARAFAIRIFTNATLIDDPTADRIAELVPLAVEVSIHGSTADVHDRTTARAGSFSRTLEGIDRLAARGVATILKTPLTRINEHQIEGLAALAASRGLPLQIDPHLTPRDDGDLGPTRFTASPAAIRRAMELGGLPDVERSRGGSNCGLGRITMAIDPEGNVFPCLQWRHRAIGNVRERPLRELWHGSPARLEAAAKSVAANDRLLDEGGPVAEFPYCPALAMQETGDALVPDAGFRLRAGIAAAIRAGTTP